MIQADMKSVSVKGGNYLFREGDASDGMYFLVSGQCEVRKKIDGKPDVPVALIKENGLFGEMSILTTGKRSGAVFFEKDAELLFWPTEKFKNFVTIHPSAGVMILLKLCELIAHRIVVKDEEYGNGTTLGELTTFSHKLKKEWAI